MSAPQPAIAPQPVRLDGRYCRLEPLDRSHVPDLWQAISGPELDARHRWLPEAAPADEAALLDWADAAAERSDMVYFAVVDSETGRCGGRHALMRIVPEHGVIEIGSILWGNGVARTRIATEAFYLTARHVFETLGYRRFEWKCNDRNLPSRRAALRFGFTYEGVFRQHMIVKGVNRDTAWFSMIDREWPSVRTRLEAWLEPENFDEDGTALTRLSRARSPAA